MEHDAKVADEQRRYDLDYKIKTEQLKIEETEKQRRFDLDKEEKDRRYETEKSLTNAEIAAKLADIELSRDKFEFDKIERTIRIGTDFEEAKRKLELEIEKFNHEKDLQIKRMKLEAANAEVSIEERYAAIERYRSKGSNVFVPIAEKAVPALLGLVGCTAAINAEKTQIITSKGFSFFNGIRK